MTAEVHANGETGQQRHSKIISSIQLCPEHPHFPSTTTWAGMKGSAFRNEKCPWGFFWPRGSSETFQDSCCSWLKHCPDWKHQSPQNTPIPGREMLEQLLCHQQSASDFSFRDFSQSKTQSRNHLMTQSQTETALEHISCGITPDPARQKWRRQWGFHRLGLAKLIKSNHLKEKNEKKQIKPV